MLVDSLQRYEGGPVDLALFKLPHHGSIRNMTHEMMAAVNCERFAISSSGSYFGHPHSSAIDIFLNALPADSEPQLWFNYLSDETRPWCDPDRQTAKKYVAKHPAEEGHFGIKVTFLTE